MLIIVQVEPSIISRFDIELATGQMYLAVIRMVTGNPQTMWDASKVLRYDIMLA